MLNNIAKSYAISDAHIVYVSLVDKAANKRKFLITKSEGDSAEFQTYGRILKADADTHLVTGVVYEPMKEDTDGNYMTEEEVKKAAYWFLKNSGDADIQHCFSKAEGVEVVESYIAPCSMEIGGEQIKKGTWLASMEITDPEVWDKVEKGEITGFSMGGKGTYSEVDVDISDPDNPVEKSDGKKKGILKQLAGLFGMDVVEKGAVKDTYTKRIIEDNFWTAFYSLSNVLLDAYDPQSGHFGPTTDITLIQDSLQDFNEIVTGLLASGNDVTKSIEKAGKKMSASNKDMLRGIYKSLGVFLEKFNDEEQEGKEVTKSEVEKIVEDTIVKAMKLKPAEAANTGSDGEGEVAKGSGEINGAGGGSGTTETITAEDVEKMVNGAIQKAVQPKEEPATKGSLQEMIEAAVAKAMEPVLKSTGLPTNLNEQTDVKKDGEETCYLHGLL